MLVQIIIKKTLNHPKTGKVLAVYAVEFLKNVLIPTLLNLLNYFKSQY